jgi:hypothetical protein
VFKRLFWLMVGIAFGATLAVMVARQIQRYRPDAVASDAAESLRRFGTELRAAVEEGRIAMAEHEAAIRADLGERSNPTGAPTASS